LEELAALLGVPGRARRAAPRGRRCSRTRGDRQGLRCGHWPQRYQRSAPASLRAQGANGVDARRNRRAGGPYLFPGGPPKMRVFPRGRALGFLALVLFLAAATSRAQAQEKWSWPERGRNLQVLPKDFPPERLRAVMGGFARSLGVRCSHCHVGKDGDSWARFDFVSDANPNKDRAREMYRMLGDINGHLKKIQPSADKRVNMWCQTCHRGRPRPTT